jgi:predicted RNase H-like HicB family nuclease
MAKKKSIDSRANYMRAALAKAEFEQTESGMWFAHIPGFEGLWATGATINQARNLLIITLNGWLEVHTRIGQHKAPVVDGLTYENDEP